MTTHITPNWPAPSNIKAYTTTRHSWGDPGCRVWMPGAIDKLVGVLELPAQPIWLKQYHGTVAIEAIPEQRGADADASFTRTSNQVCMVETADCPPILICSRQGDYAAAIHAGWRGLANGIIETTVQSSKQSADDLLVWLGPAIGPDRFEVGRDVYDAFVSKHPTAVRAFASKNGDKWLANLYDLARLRLKELGVTAIYGGDYCTHTQEDLFYSYRRDGSTTGRMASVIWIA